MAAHSLGKSDERFWNEANS